MKSPIFVFDIGDYDRDPDLYQKEPHNPFPTKSETWKIFYFMSYGKRRGQGKVRLYQSYGRNENEALKGLIAATKRKDTRAITRAEYRELKKKTKVE